MGACGSVRCARPMSGIRRPVSWCGSTRRINGTSPIWSQKSPRPWERRCQEDELPMQAYYGDGAPLEPAVLEAIRAAYRQVTVTFPWQAGDVLLLDNMLTAHGRMPFVGPRTVLVAMGDACESQRCERRRHDSRKRLKGFRLSLQQRRVWRLQQASLAYRAQCAVLLTGHLNTHGVARGHRSTSCSAMKFCVRPSRASRDWSFRCRSSPRGAALAGRSSTSVTLNAAGTGSENRRAVPARAPDPL